MSNSISILLKGGPDSPTVQMVRHSPALRRSRTTKYKKDEETPL
jgi:hypothetical protein